MNTPLKSRRIKKQEAIMSPQTKKQKTEETLIGHEKDDVPYAAGSSLPRRVTRSPAEISNERRFSIQAMAAMNEHENRLENGASQTRHQKTSSTYGNHESNILARNVTPESRKQLEQEEPGNDTDGKNEPKPKTSWFTLIGGHAIDFDDDEYFEYPTCGITVSVSEDGSEVDVRKPTYFTK